MESLKRAKKFSKIKVYQVVEVLQPRDLASSDHKEVGIGKLQKQ
jgi:hypothetical protein